MKVAACDDEMIYCNQVENFFKKISKEYRVEIQCDKYTSGLQLLENDINQYSIIFLDIDMEDENGLQVAEKIRKENQTVELIFLTAYQISNSACIWWMYQPKEPDSIHENNEK